MKLSTKLFLACVITMLVLPLSPTLAKKEDGDNSEKKEKVKKERPPFVWTMPALTKNENFDEYLLTCDTLYNSITSFADHIPMYNVAYYQDVDPETGEALFNEDGEPEYCAVIEDQNGVVRNAGGVMLQYTDIILTGTDILLNCTLVTTMSATAALELPALGVAALSYGKYIKAGPIIANMGLGEIKEIVENLKLQSASIKSLKEGSTTQGELAEVKMTVSADNIPDDIDISELAVLDDNKLAEMNAAIGDVDVNATSADDLI